MPETPKRIGVLTGGGDCPGLNAVIRAVAKPAILQYGMTVFGIEDGFEGLVEGRMRELRPDDLSGIINVGGTILGTSNKADPFHYPVTDHDGTTKIVDASAKALKNLKAWGIDALVAIGGDGTMHICKALGKLDVNVVGVPKTIDNDLFGTDLTFGFNSAVYVATEAVDRLHTTASSHHRVMVLEVMGRYAGWIALYSGMAGGADVILIPEIPFTWERVFDKVVRRSTQGKRSSIVVVAEGSEPPEGGLVVKRIDERRVDPKQLGGIGDLVARQIQGDTGLESRATVLGHLQRGGSPTPFDRVLATRFGYKACQLVAERTFDRMVALRGETIESIAIEESIKSLKLVNPDGEKVRTAIAVGTSFGAA